MAKNTRGHAMSCPDMPKDSLAHATSVLFLASLRIMVLGNNNTKLTNSTWQIDKAFKKHGASLSNETSTA